LSNWFIFFKKGGGEMIIKGVQKTDGTKPEKLPTGDVILQDTEKGRLSDQEKIIALLEDKVAHLVHENEVLSNKLYLEEKTNEHLRERMHNMGNGFKVIRGCMNQHLGDLLLSNFFLIRRNRVLTQVTKVFKRLNVLAPEYEEEEESDHGDN
jgi:isocitrate dehydrogenase kinase/phosphatase